MKNSKHRLLICLLAVMLCMAVFSMSALADGGDYESDELPLETPVVTEAPAEETPQEEDPGELPEGMSLDDWFTDLLSAFTPDGNLSLIDDFNYTGKDEDGNTVGKQFITVQSKSGNYFFIIIDRAATTENVYFLNMVDEADLLALMDEPEPEAPAVCTCKDKCYAGHVDITCPVCAVNMSECKGKEAQPEPTKKSATVNPMAAVVLLLALGGGAAYYFLKVRGKEKPRTKGGTDLAEYNFGEDEGEEYEFEPYEPEAEGGGTGKPPEDGA
ncbi:MAG: DUF4366 domain-containing protein [Acidaminococcaceae bacterium]|nr:DUF4366 domain-containing protein [Acidaminococcaceae bacterium]